MTLPRPFGRKWRVLGVLLLVAAVALADVRAASDSDPDDDAPSETDEYDAYDNGNGNGNGTWTNDTGNDYDSPSGSNGGANRDSDPANTASKASTASAQTNGRVSPGARCDLQAAFDCRCVFQQNLGGYKVTCELLGLSSVPSELMSKLPARTVYLSFQRNMIRQIRKSDLRNVSSLRVLDLSNNLIDAIEPGSFEGLLQLTKLNLSDNRLQQINASLFTGLTNLKRLSLSANRLPTVPRSVIRSLPNLRNIGFTSMSLICDCRLKWIVDYAAQVRIDDNPQCGKPQKQRGKRVRKLEFDQLGCDSEDQSVYDTPNSPIYLELSPSRDQFSLQGDPLSITCRAHNLIEAQLQSERSRLFWEHAAESSAATRLGATLILPGDHPNGLTVNNFMNREPQQSNSYRTARQQAEGNYFVSEAPVNERQRSLVTSAASSSAPVLFWTELSVQSLEIEHSGLWKCILTTPVGNFTKAINVRVLGRDLAQCNPIVMRSTSGILSWPRTLANMASTLPCPLGPARFSLSGTNANGNDQRPLLMSMNAAMAHYRCDGQGSWTQLDTSACRNSSQIDETISELLSYRVDIVSVHQLLAYIQRIVIHARASIGPDQLRSLVTLLERTMQPFRDTANSSMPLPVSAPAPPPPSSPSSSAQTANVGTAYADEQRNADDVDAFDRLFTAVELVSSLDVSLLSETEQREQVATRLVRLVQDVAYVQVLLNRSVREFARSTSSFIVVAMRLSASQFLPPAGGNNGTSKWLVCRVMATDSSFLHRCERADSAASAQNEAASNDFTGNESNFVEVARFSVPLGAMLNDKQIAADIDREAEIAAPLTTRKLYETSVVVQDDANAGRKSRRQFRSARNRNPPDTGTLATATALASSSTSATNGAAQERSVLVQFAYFSSARLFPSLSWPQPAANSPSPNIVSFMPQTGLVTMRIGGLQSVPIETDYRILLRFNQQVNASSAAYLSRRRMSSRTFSLTFNLAPRRPESNVWMADDLCTLVSGNDTHLRCSVFGMWAATAARTVDRMRQPFGAFAFDTVVYVGAMISIACVCAILVTYIGFRRSIKMSYKLRHATMNLNADFVALVATFLFGTLRTDSPIFCTCAGAVVHFLTLSIVCWFSIWAYVLFRKSHKFRTYMKRPAHQTLLENANELFATQQCSALSTGSAVDTPTNGSRRGSRTRWKPRRATEESQSLPQLPSAPLLTAMTSSCTSATAAPNGNGTGNGNESQAVLGQSIVMRSRVRSSRKISTARWKKLVRLYIFAYGISAIVVIVTLSLTAATYVQGGCAPANASLWAPAGVLTVLNVILFVSIMTSVCSSSFDRYLDHFKRHRHSYERFVAASSAQSCTCTVSTPLGNGNATATMTATASFATNTLRQTTPPLAVPTVSASFTDANSLVRTASRRGGSNGHATDSVNSNGRHAVVSCTNLTDPSCDSLFNNSDFTSANAHRTSAGAGSGRCAAHHGNAAMTASSILLFVYSVKQSNKEQFYTLLALYVLYAAAWCFAALCVLESLEAASAEPLMVADDSNGVTLARGGSVRDVVFAYLFAVCVTAFGIVELVYFAVLRGDVRSAWIDTLKRRRSASYCCVSSSGSYSVSPLHRSDSQQYSQRSALGRPESQSEQPFQLATPIRKRSVERSSAERFIREPPAARSNGVQPSFVEPTYIPIVHAPTAAGPSTNGSHQATAPINVALSPHSVHTAHADSTRIDADADAEANSTRPPASPATTSLPQAVPTPACPENSAYTSPHDSRVFTIADVDLLSDVAQSVARNRSEKQKQLAMQNAYEARRRRERASHDVDRHGSGASRPERTRTRPRHAHAGISGNSKSPLRGDRSAGVGVHGFSSVNDGHEKDANVIANTNSNTPVSESTKHRSVNNGGVPYAVVGSRVHFETSPQNNAFGPRQSTVTQPLPVEDEYIAVRSLPNRVVTDSTLASAGTCAELELAGNAESGSCAVSSCSECDGDASGASVESIKQETCV